MAVSEKNYGLEVILSEANGTRSREVVTIASGQNLKAGQIVGKITTGGKYAICNQDAEDGSEEAAGVLLYAVDASAADAKGVILARDAEVKDDLLEYKSDADAGEKATMRAELAALGIITRF